MPYCSATWPTVRVSSPCRFAVVIAVMSLPCGLTSRHGQARLTTVCRRPWVRTCLAGQRSGSGDLDGGLLGYRLLGGGLLGGGLLGGGLLGRGLLGGPLASHRASGAFLCQQLCPTFRGDRLRLVILAQGCVGFAVGDIRADAALLDHHRLTGPVSYTHLTLPTKR